LQQLRVFRNEWQKHLKANSLNVAQKTAAATAIVIQKENVAKTEIVVINN
jgi:hypothetical protein